MRIQESGEMYLETILRLSQKSGHVRAIDVGEEMGYSKPSVSRAMSLLKEGGYIVIDRDGAITLTDAGREIAEKIYARHTLLTNFLISIGVDEEIASEDIRLAMRDELEQIVRAIKSTLEETPPELSADIYDQGITLTGEAKTCSIRHISAAN